MRAQITTTCTAYLAVQCQYCCTLHHVSYSIHVFLGNALSYLHIGPFFSSGRGSLLALSAAGNAPACTAGARLGPGRAPWRVLWAFNVARAGRQSRDCIPPRRDSQDDGTPTLYKDLCSAVVVRVSCLYHTVPQALRLSAWWQPWYNSSHTSSSSPLVTAADGACVRVSVCVMFPVDVGNRNEHKSSREMQFIGCCAVGAGRYNFALGDFKSNRAATVPTTTKEAVEQRYNSTSAPDSGPF